MINALWGLRSRCILLLLVVSFTGCCGVDTKFQNFTAGGEPSVIKSENDQRDYRYLVLPNHLKVLLVSDPKTDKAAASLDVFVGSAADPKAYPGLAHFLEHMLFLGTEKYPRADEYQSFISDHGGSHNAYTAFEHTNYFFDIDPTFLEPTLDRFAQFFIAPLFTEQYVEREKHAVHSEYMSKIKDDQRKSLDVVKALVNPDHPFSKFSVGNLETLAVDEGKPPLRDELLAFHDKHYSAGIMTLVVLGKEPLAALEQMVRQRFTAIRDNGTIVDTIAQPLFSKQAPPMPLMVDIKPEKERRSLSLVFPTDEEITHYRQKPLQYISNILGHEGQGSLLSWLKAKGWAEGLSAGSGLSYNGGATFDITIDLTREGVSEVDNIVTTVFQTVNRIRQTPHQQWLYDEQKRLAAQNFRFQESMSPINYVMGLSTGMQYYPPADVLRGPYVMEQYDAKLIAGFLADLVPENALISLSAPEVETNQHSYYYQTPYGVAAPSALQLQRWSHAGLNAAIQLPAPNPFIAENLALDAPDLNPEERSIYAATKPALVQSGAGYKLWYKPDSEFNLPKGSVLVSVDSPLASDTPKHQVLLKMFTALVEDKLNELSYPARLAGLNYAVTPTQRGFTITINGYNDKQALLLHEILAAIASAQFEPRRFENIKLEQIRRLDNTIKEQPYRRLIDGLQMLLYRNQFSTEDLLQAYQPITLDSLLEYRRQLLATTELNVLVYGNYRQSEAESMLTKMKDVLLHQPFEADVLEVAKLNKSSYALPVNSDYTDAALLMYLQGADLDKRTRAAMGLTAQIFRSDFYTKLRTEKQLGYIVTSGAYPVRDVPGLFFLVQSPVAGAGTLQQEIDTFLDAQLAVADAMTEEQFARQRDALVLRLAEVPKNLWERSEKYWQNINQHYVEFDFDDQLIAALESLSLQQWQQLFKQQMLSRERAVWVYAQGKFSDDAAVKGRPIDDMNRVKQQLRYYQFP